MVLFFSFFLADHRATYFTLSTICETSTKILSHLSTVIFTTKRFVRVESCGYFVTYLSIVFHIYGSQTRFVRHIVFAPCLIIITSHRLLSGDVLLLYFSLLLLLLLLLFHTYLSARFLGDALIKLYETL